MTFEHSLETSLENVQANVSALLAYLRSGQTGVINNHGGPGDPFEHAPRQVLQSRKELAEAATRLVQLGTRPEEYLEHLSNSASSICLANINGTRQYQEQSCVRWLVSLDVLRHIPAEGTISYAALASTAGVPQNQLRGVARMAVCNGFLEEPQSGHVAHGRMSALLVRDEKFMNWARWMLNYSVPVAYRHADATHRWGETDARDQTAFQVAMNTSEPFFDYVRKSPEMTDLFSGYMRNVTASGTWSLDHAVDGFDWASLPRGAKVVDVGGSHGQLAVQVAKRHPHLNFVVQDLPETVATAQKAFDADEGIDKAVKSRIQFMPANFFEPQPVTDAPVYFLRMIIHDWPDKDALTILQHLHSVLKKNPGARIVIMDTVLPPPGTISVLLEQQLRTRDLMMMQVFNARERELEDWKSLVSRVGMEVARIEQPLDSVMALLTVQLDGDLQVRRLNEPPPVRIDSPLDQKDNVPVLIMGAGISGLCLAQALNKAGIDFQVFERDPAINSRPQGFRLKLEKDGAQALLTSLPPDTYDAFKTSCAITAVGESDFSPFNGTLIKSREGGGLSRNQGLVPFHTVDRTAFRDVLMTGIKDRISFGKELSAYCADKERGIVTATFKDGCQVEGRFLVGADGLHSPVRRQLLPGRKIIDTGGSCVYGKTPMSAELRARFPEKAMRWMTVVSDSAPMLQSCLIGDSPVTLLVEPIRFDAASRLRHQLPPDYLYWALVGPKQRFVGSSDPASISMEITKEWHHSIRSLFEFQDTRQTTFIRIASEVPSIKEWETSPLVALLGDAIHPMSPCGGVGANASLCDAAALGRVLVEAEGRPDVKAIAASESDMRNRAARMIRRAEIGSQKMYGSKPFVECEPWIE
ncbi:hypothetical protein LTR37_008378 [Vermiconidia calcicola]|uniref:Uncharacterized protein n=1 Tax=Vermiconidia calcicola TaxID=1690605 RepID=A0ACC3NAX7_9PEZI|nr:hypothetical protein LTR37_008378 [Vermiconidia calcicola]